jgi:hypothetical protein
MQLKRIIIDERGEDQVVILSEVGGPRSLPIVIGFYEAVSIDRRVKHMKMPRPMAHDLILQTIRELGGEPHDIVINDLREKTYFALLRVKIEGEVREIDCRPSDAIAVAVIAKLPIYVHDSILNEALEL